VINVKSALARDCDKKKQRAHSDGIYRKCHKNAKGLRESVPLRTLPPFKDRKSSQLIQLTTIWIEEGVNQQQMSEKKAEAIFSR
jgi:hypothetical protein